MLRGECRVGGVDGMDDWRVWAVESGMSSSCVLRIVCLVRAVNLREVCVVCMPSGSWTPSRSLETLHLHRVT